ncbi:MAG: HAD family hydrolase [Ruminococcus sp.]|nr:HAD family hydrolase [Ruminococcus sp.]
MSVKGIFFDLDGTLWDSSAQVTAGWNKCIAEKTDRPERFTVDDLHGFMGKLMEAIAAEMFPTLPQEEQLRIMKMCYEYEDDAIRADRPYFYEHEREVLEQLSKEYKLAVISNCQEGYIELYMDHCGFPELFCDFESAGATGMPKADNIRLVMERQGVDKCVYVGDTRGDEEAARGAGVAFIHAAYGFGTPEAPDASIMSLSELPEAAARLLAD